MDHHRLASRLVCEQILDAVVHAPEAVALCHGKQTVSYAELERRSSQFAAHLASLGVRPGQAVAICLDRSVEWIIAALGVLRIGAAYVPLDHGWAEERLRFAVSDCGATLVVGRQETLDRLSLTVRGLDPFSRLDVAREIPAFEDFPIEGDSLAYVIYTSGSTGVPKGVEITHANLAHLIQWHKQAFSITCLERMSHVAGLGFDAAVWELWPALAAGATIVIPDDSIRSSPALLQQWLVDEQVTVSFVPTALAQSMVHSSWPGDTSLRFLLTGGDALSRGPMGGLPFQVVNNYGPTECTVVATSGVLEAGDGGAPTIGREIAGTVVYLLDEKGQEVPRGTPGEIHIGGAGVGRGYRNLPALTDSVFLPDVFAGGNGARMYRTGDLAVRLPSGELAFRGRLDRQIKIRGQRVELDEVSSVLGRHGDIEFATTTSVVSADGENQLVAYVLPKDEAMVPTQAQLQNHLSASLPRYMIPSMFVRLRALPLSKNGKIDLTLLERPNKTNLLGGVAGRAADNPIEENLLLMVQELISNDTVALHDDFFLVGGHSLIGMQLVLRIRERFGVDVTLRQLFQSSTVERLAAVIEGMIIESIEDLSDAEAGMQLAE